MSQSQNNFRNRSCESFTGRSELRYIGTYIGNDFTNGHRGHARAVAGAKKFIRSRIRADSKRALQIELNNLVE